MQVHLVNSPYQFLMPSGVRSFVGQEEYVWRKRAAADRYRLMTITPNRGFVTVWTEIELYALVPGDNFLGLLERLDDTDLAGIVGLIVENDGKRCEIRGSCFVPHGAGTAVVKGYSLLNRPISVRGGSMVYAFDFQQKGLIALQLHAEPRCYIEKIGFRYVSWDIPTKTYQELLATAAGG